MRTIASLGLWSGEQPNPVVWSALEQHVRDWNARHASTWAPREGDGYGMEIDTATAEYAELRLLLAEHVERDGAQMAELFTKLYDEADFECGDLVLVDGYELESEVDVHGGPAGHPSFLQNQENWAPPSRCRGCGYIFGYAGEQLGPFVVDEWFLDHRYRTDRHAWTRMEHPWDLITMPGGELVISGQVAETLDAERVSGFELGDVLDSRTGKRSRRLVQLQPKHWSAWVCAEHSMATGGMCTVCRRVLGDVEGELHLRRESVRDEIVGYRPGGLRITYLAQRVYRLLVALRVTGLEPDSPVYLCSHDERGTP